LTLGPKYVASADQGLTEWNYWTKYVHKAVNHRQNFVNTVNGVNTPMIERAWRCACLTIIKNANTVRPTSFPGYLAELWWRSMHVTTPFNDFVAELAKQFPMH